MDLDWQEIKESEGLPSNYTYALLPSDEGSLWIGTENGLAIYDGFRARSLSSREDTVSFETPTYFTARFKNQLWAATRRGVQIYDISSKEKLDWVVGENKIVEDIHFLNDNKVLVTYYLGFYEVDLDEEGRPVKVTDHPLTALLENGSAIVNEFFLDRKNRLYISIAGYGLLRGPLDSISRWYEFPMLDIPFLSDQYSFKQCITILEKNDGNLLLNFIEEGIYELDIDDGKFSPFGGMSVFDPEFSPISAGTISNDFLIVAQLGSGLVCGNVSDFEKTKRTFDFSSLPDFDQWGNNITSVKILGSSVWLATLGDGIKYAPLSSNGIRLLSLQQHVKKNTSIYTVKLDNQDQLWVGTNGEGIIKAGVGDNGLVDIVQLSMDNNLLSLPTDSINEIHFGKDGALWIATSQGVLKYTDAPEMIRRIKAGMKVVPKRFEHKAGDSTTISSNVVNDLFEDQGGNMFLTSLKGLNIINTEGNVLNHQNHNDIPFLKESRTIYYGDFLSDSSIVLNGPWVNAIYQRNELLNYNEIIPLEKTLYVLHMAKGEFYDWVGTTRGLFKYDPKKGVFVDFVGQEYFRSIKLNAVIVSDGKVWMGTNRGLYSYEIESGEIKNYPLSSGEGSPFFNLGSVAKNSKGQLFFGTSKGIVMVDPEKISKSGMRCSKNCQVYISGASLNQSKINLTRSKKDDQVVYDPIEIGQEDLLELFLGFPIYHVQDEIEIQFSLDGSQWLETARKMPKIVLHQLSADTYNLKVKALSKGGRLMSGLSIPLYVMNPWYARWYAFGSYLIVIGCVIFALIKFKLNRVRQIQRWELEHSELRQRQEVNDLKFEFISNISHELRTPLTLLLNEISRLKNGTVSPEISQKIKSHTERLKSLANEMLDLKGVGDEELKLTVGEYNLVDFAKDRLRLFEEIAAERGVTLSLVSSKDPLMLWFNPHQFEKVIFNLLTNAIKFTPKDGEVRLRCSVEKGVLSHDQLQGDVSYVKLEVSDTGCGIEAEVLPVLFSSDYSNPNIEETEFDSAGIGLYLCKKIVDLHFGDIDVCSEIGKGTTFTVRLPMGHFHYEDDQLERVKSEMTPSALYMMKSSSNNSLGMDLDIPVVLTVEDNFEIIEIYKQIFAENFKHHIAKNGIEGIEMAKSIVPDIIITDLSMPGKSGTALIQAIKKDEYLSHIPIIVLTSFASDEQRIDILNQGADAFIPKPFDSEILLARVRNLLLSRKLLKEMFSDKTISFGDLVKQSPDSDLLKRIISVVEKNMTDPDLDVAMLADQLKMSRSLLYLKLSNLTNYSPKEFIHIMRVRKGAKLLKSGTFRVKEVAYYVGYNSQKNFRKYFKDYHGVAPSDYIRHKV